MGMLSLGATTQTGFMALADAWGIAETEAEKHGQQVNRAHWRVVGPMHIAETREQAHEEVRFGLGEWCRYFSKVLALPFDLPEDLDGQIKKLTETGYAVIGTPEDAINQIERLLQQSGGFGAFLQMAVNWADFSQTKRSYELMARYVLPHFNQLNTNRRASWNWAEANHETFMTANRQAKAMATEKYKKEQEEK